MAIKNEIKPNDIEWTMTWSKYQTESKKEDEVIFEEDKALAHLLINEVVFLNSYWWKYKNFTKWNKEERRFESEVKPDARWTEEESEIISVSVNCNDIFVWGCADSEELPFNEIENLYKLWKADPDWGPAKWCAIRRKEQPQLPVIERMKKAGVWDEIMENLGPNLMDDEVKAYFATLVTQRNAS